MDFNDGENSQNEWDEQASWITYCFMAFAFLLVLIGLIFR